MHVEKPAMKCTRKHTKYQVEDADWACPECGATSDKGDGNFVLESEALTADECPLMHMDDYVVCYACNYTASANSYANRVQKQKNLVPCPCCKGKGFVPRQ